MGFEERLRLLCRKHGGVKGFDPGALGQVSNLEIRLLPLNRKPKP